MTDEVKPLSSSEDAIVPVQRRWFDWRTVRARMSDLHDVHWLQPPGAPRALLHAYVDSADLLTSELTREDDARVGDRLLVCVLKSHLAASTYAALAALADKAQARSTPAPW